MFICSNCFENEIKWSDGSSKYQWCEDCVRRGCSCNEEIFLTKTKEYIEQNEDFTFEEDLLKLKKDINENKLKNVKIKFSNKGITKPNSKQNYYSIEATKSNFKEDRNKLKLFLNKDNNSFIEEFIKDTDNSIKIIYLDGNKRELPCCEVMYIEEKFIKEKKDIIFSMKLNRFLVISEIYDNGSFRCYEITDFKNIEKNKYGGYEIENFSEIEYDHCNSFYYNKEGFDYNSSQIDLVIESFEVNNKEFILLNKLLFNTSESKILENMFKVIDKDKKITNKKLAKDILDEYNDDFGFYCEEYIDINKLEEYYTENKENLELTLYIQNLIKKEVLFILKNELKNNKYVNDILIEHLFNLIIEFHKKNDYLKYSDVLDSSVHFGCDCGCGGDMIDDNEINFIDDKLEERKKVFIELFKIIYENIKEEKD